MTEEVRNKINSLPNYLRKDGEIMCYKSDVISLVEELTRWNDAKNIKPAFCELGFSALIYFKDETNCIHVGWCKFSVHNGWRFVRQCDGRDFYYDYITEWKYIN